MKPSRRPFFSSLVSTAAAALLLLQVTGCGNFFSSSGRYEMCRAPRCRRLSSATTAQAVPPAHGGDKVPNGEAYDAMFFKNYGVNPFVDADVDRLSTFALDVDTASYTVARRMLTDGNLPPEAAVRVEEFVNYFDYLYTPPEQGAFRVHLDGSPSPFRKECALIRVGIKGRVIDPADRKRAILTFVVDISGSMDRENRLGLVRKSLELLVNNLREGDEVALVAYGASAVTLLNHTGVENKEKILDAIDDLRPGGCTNADEGLTLGYRLASEARVPGAVNRVILCSDGVANMGRTSAKGILDRIKRYARSGITLSSVGFGMGNYNDIMMEQLGDKGNGHYAYVDTLDEARRLFQDNLSGTLQVVARDVKAQVDFNPAVVRSYRLVGYENRDVADRDFRNDAVDGGELGAGHSVTALYQVRLWEGKKGRIAEVRLRYKDPENDTVTEMNTEMWTADIQPRFQDCSEGFRLAAVTARFAEILRKSYWAREGSLGQLSVMAQSLVSEFDDRKDVKELASLIRKAAELKADSEEEEGAAVSKE